MRTLPKARRILVLVCDRRVCVLETEPPHALEWTFTPMTKLDDHDSSCNLGLPCSSSLRVDRMLGLSLLRAISALNEFQEFVNAP